jgi:hypothetical protein
MSGEELDVKYSNGVGRASLDDDCLVQLQAGNRKMDYAGAIGEGQRLAGGFQPDVRGFRPLDGQVRFSSGPLADLRPQ